LETASVARTVENASVFGVHAQKLGLDWAATMTRKQSVIDQLVAGLAGLLKGATGMSGPPVILYLLSGAEEAKRHRANLIIFFAIIAVTSILGPIVMGLIDVTTFARLAVVLPVMFVSVPVGVRAFHVVPQRLYRPFAMAVLAVAGCIALFG
jgi:uncharacterized membrane protein YfcA